MFLISSEKPDFSEKKTDFCRKTCFSVFLCFSDQKYWVFSSSFYKNQDFLQELKFFFQKNLIFLILVISFQPQKSMATANLKNISSDLSTC